MDAETLEHDSPEAPRFEGPEFERRLAARNAFTRAHSKWMGALAELATLNASPDGDEDEFNAAIEAVYEKRRTAIDSIMDAPPQNLGQLLQKFAVIEDVALDQTHTAPGSDNPLLALVASVKADVLRQAI